MNNEYINVGKKILKKLINNGFEAYFVGEAVRDSILHNTIKRVDITTSAYISAIKKIFDDCYIQDVNEISIVLDYEDYSFYIQTFRVLETNDKNSFLSKHYSKNLLDDLTSRDFSINAVAMSHSGKLTDALHGYDDIMKKRINHIGNAKIKFSNNPELMIKAFALMSELNYRLTNRTKNAINRRRKYLLTCDMSLYMDDFQKIFNSKYSKNAILMMNKTNIDMVLPLFKKVIRRLGSHYKPVNFEEVLLMAFVLNGKIDLRYADYITDINVFNKIFDLALQNRLCEYDDLTLYTNGLEICLEANYINFVLGRCPKKDKKIRKQWSMLPIKSIKDLQYSNRDVAELIDTTDESFVNDILEDVAITIVSGEIHNNYHEIQSMVIKLLKKNNMNYKFSGGYDSVPSEFITKTKMYEEKEDDYYEYGNTSNQYYDPYPQNNYGDFSNQKNSNNRVEELEQLIREQARQIREQNRRLQEAENYKRNKDIDKIMDTINNNDQIKELVKDSDDFKGQLHKFLSDYMKDEEDS